MRGGYRPVPGILGPGHRAVLDAARAAGFEQAELEAVSTNAPAVALYQKLGFETTGTVPRAMRYKDGTYADFLFMVKDLA